MTCLLTGTDLQTINISIMNQPINRSVNHLLTLLNIHFTLADLHNIWKQHQHVIDCLNFPEI